MKKPEISPSQIRSLEQIRVELRSMKKLVESLETLEAEAEQKIIAQLDAGAEPAVGGVALAIKTTERRYPHWRKLFEKHAGRALAVKILATTPATIYRALVIRHTAEVKEAA